MGRATQYFDYLTRKPEDFSLEIVDRYTHFTISERAKKIRRELKLYKDLSK